MFPGRTDGQTDRRTDGRTDGRTAPPPSVSYLLEPDVQVEGDGVSGVADGRDAVLHVLGRAAGDQLHGVGPGVVSHLGGGRGGRAGGETPGRAEYRNGPRFNPLDAHRSLCFYLVFTHSDILPLLVFTSAPLFVFLTTLYF